MARTVADRLKLENLELREALRLSDDSRLIAQTQLDAERQAIAGLAEQLTQQQEFAQRFADRANAAEIAAAELRGGLRALQGATFALLGQMAFQTPEAG